MRKNLCIILLTIIFLIGVGTPVSVNAFETGLLIDQNAGYGGIGGEAQVDYQANFIPRLSFLIGESADFYISAGLALKYENNYEDETFSVIPELLRTEFLMSLNSAKIRAGRIYYTDPLGFIADGLFDGAQFLYDTSAGTFGVGAWYTGLLYKETAYITITPEDTANYFSEDTYFAPRRLVAAADWEHPFIAETVQLNAALIAQTDLNDVDNPYHSQYVTLKLGISAAAFVYELGGGLEIIEYTDDVKIAFAGLAGIYWTLPASFHSRLSFTGRFTSGTVEDSSFAAFTPITAQPQGDDILQAKLSALSILSLDYTARIHRTMSAGMTASYFVRSDLGTYLDYPVSAAAEQDNGHFVGGELTARFVWAPLSDLQFTASGGVFLPSLGNAAPEADPQWRAEVGVVIAF